jgi:hypothetical protein
VTKLAARIDTWIAAAFEVRTPGQAHVLNVVLLLSGLVFAGFFAFVAPETQADAQRLGPATVLSWLPDVIALDPRVRQACFAVYALAAGCWLAGRFLPWSCWVAAMSFTAGMALYHEGWDQTNHTSHLTAVLLFTFALWHHLEAEEIRRARVERRFLSTPLYPRWMHELCILAVGLFYGWAGLSKLLESGVGWVNGVSLQLWVREFGVADSLFGAPLLANRSIALGLQASSLAVELAALIAVFVPLLRRPVGLGLTAFHAGIVLVFGWGFHANAVIVALLLLPRSPFSAPSRAISRR